MFYPACFGRMFFWSVGAAVGNDDFMAAILLLFSACFWCPLVSWVGFCEFLSLPALVLDGFVLVASFDFARGPLAKPFTMFSASGPAVSGLEGEDEELAEPNFLAAADLNGAGPLRLDFPLTAGDLSLIHI